MQQITIAKMHESLHSGDKLRRDSSEAYTILVNVISVSPKPVEFSFLVELWHMMQTANSKAPCALSGQGVHSAEHGHPVLVWIDAMGEAVVGGEGEGGGGRAGVKAPLWQHSC